MQLFGAESAEQAFRRLAEALARYRDSQATDQPYGGDWKGYSLEGFGDQTFGAERYFKNPDVAKLSRLKCPACGEVGLVSAKH